MASSTTYPILDQIKAYFKTEPETKIETPQVLVQELIDPINFKYVMTNLVTYAKDDSVQGIILIIDSPGGSTSQFSALHDLIKKVASIKPVVAFISNSAQSCGYLVASAADYIIAPSCSEIGAIGIFLEVARYKDPKVKNNEINAALDLSVFKVGKYKTVQHPHADQLSDEDREYLNDLTAKVYSQFITHVAHNRNLDISTSSEWAEGRVFIGHHAVEAGLIDQIGTYFDAEAKIVELIRAKNPVKQYTDTIVPILV